MRSSVIIISAVVVMVLCIALGLVLYNHTEPITPSVPAPGDQSQNAGGDQGKLKADVFSGILETVDTGCFADGECFITVDGKHVTAIMGWSQEVVGTIQGVAGFGDLAEHIGEPVEVYAQVQDDGTYTLYGSEGFHIKLLTESEGDTPSAAPGNDPLQVDGEQSGSDTRPVVRNDCAVGGCSGQLCLDASSAAGMVTTCEYRASYGCYQTAICERQTSGMCGWTETAALSQCLMDADREVLEVL